MSGRSRLCKQVSIETPVVDTRGEAIFSFDVPVPDVPPQGARIQVICAGVCYRRRPSGGSLGSGSGTPPPSPAIKGIRDGSLFPGYEVAGIIDALGPSVSSELALEVGDKVIVYPYDDLPSMETGYAEFISVPDAKYLIKVPMEVDMTVAATLPSGALWAVNAVDSIRQILPEILKDQSFCNLLVVGTGGLAQWTLKVASHFLSDLTESKQIRIVVATLRDDSLEDGDKWKLVSWGEDMYESHLIERTKDACSGGVDIVLDFGATPRSLGRSLRCVRPNAVILVGEECHEVLQRKFERHLRDAQVQLRPVSMGSLEQLQHLVELVASKQVSPPPYSVFAVENATEALQQLSQSAISGRAVLEFRKL